MKRVEWCKNHITDIIKHYDLEKKKWRIDYIMEKNKQSNLFQNVVDELNTNDIFQKFLQPLIKTTKKAFYPYFLFHVFVQIVILSLLLLILYRLHK